MSSKASNLIDKHKNHVVVQIGNSDNRNTVGTSRRPSDGKPNQKTNTSHRNQRSLSDNLHVHSLKEALHKLSSDKQHHVTNSLIWLRSVFLKKPDNIKNFVTVSS